jgi:hypothetical protein
VHLFLLRSSLGGSDTFLLAILSAVSLCWNSTGCGSEKNKRYRRTLRDCSSVFCTSIYSIYLSIPISTYLHIHSPICLSLTISISVPAHYLYLSSYPFTYLSIPHHIHLCTCPLSLPIFISIHLSVYPSRYPSLYLPTYKSIHSHTLLHKALVCVNA